MENSPKTNEKTNYINEHTSERLSQDLNDQAKREICSTTFYKPKEGEPSKEEVQNKIDEINEKYSYQDEIESRDEEEYDKLMYNRSDDQLEELNTIYNQKPKTSEDSGEGALNIDEIMISQNGIKRNTPNNLQKVDQENEKSKKESSQKLISSKDYKSEFEVVNQDSYLKPFEGKIKQRMTTFNNLIRQIEQNEGGLLNFSQSYKIMGINITNEGITYREYAPGAKAMTIFGDFNNWNRDEYQCERDEFGFWKILIPLRSNGELPIKHNTKIKINMVLSNGKREDRNPVWSRYLIQNKDSFLYDTVFWNPEESYIWENPGFLARPKSLKIYEAHVGMSSVEPKVSSYREFADNILPRIKAAGYTAIQLMAIMEHAYYASFGYHVTNFFAIASRSGTPDDLKYLIDTAHGMGLYVIMDIIHSHASSNVLDGLNLFDGTDYLYFHGGPKGFHKLWDSRLFNYKNWETLRLLTSNCAWYMDEYHFDGFRFDGVTSILYSHHGINHSFVNGLSEYFNDSVDLDGEVYLMLANYLIHTKNPNATTIAEDVSGMPTLCRPIEEGGFGFDYRLNMSVPDKWIELLKEQKDEQWNMGNIVFTLTNRRYNEKHITYSESHDQSIVGDKTISMWLFDKEIYFNMSSNHKPTIVVDRGMALHKMIRLITFSLGGEAYMNFIGNEFGHPEWVDFPRPGNNNSYHYCRRQWNLCDDKNLRFKYLFEFDKYMNQLDSIFGILSSKHQYITLRHEKDKLIVFEKGDLLFIFNFHPNQSFEHYRIGTKWASEHKIILDTDESKFGGINRLIYGHQNKFPIIKEKWMNRPNYIQLYIPSRSGIVLLAEENFDKYDFTALNI